MSTRNRAMVGRRLVTYIFLCLYAVKTVCSVSHFAAASIATKNYQFLFQFISPENATSPVRGFAFVKSFGKTGLQPAFHFHVHERGVNIGQSCDLAGPEFDTAKRRLLAMEEIGRMTAEGRFANKTVEEVKSLISCSAHNQIFCKAADLSGRYGELIAPPSPEWISVKKFIDSDISLAPAPNQASTQVLEKLMNLKAQDNGIVGRTLMVHDANMKPIGCAKIDPGIISPAEFVNLR